jgi:transposase
VRSYKRFSPPSQAQIACSESRSVVDVIGWKASIGAVRRGPGRRRSQCELYTGFPCIHAAFVDAFRSDLWHTAVMVAVPLPDLDSLDVEALKALAITQHGELNKQREALAEQRQILAEQSQTLAERIKELRSGNERIEHLKLVIEKLRSRMFGAKSEKIVVRLEQLELHLEELESWQAEMEAAVETVSPAAEPKTRSPRKPLPEQLTRKVIPHLPQGDCCPDCGGQLRPFGEDVAELLEYVPESFKGIHHVRPKFACAACERVVDPPAPARPIERGLPGPGLLAHVPVSKFCGHLPHYCQPEIYAREGVDLDRSTLAGWVGAASELLTPLVDEIRKHVLAASKIHADDTPVPVLAPGNGKTKTAGAIPVRALAVARPHALRGRRPVGNR